MLQTISSLSGLVVVSDVWDCPSLPLVSLMCKQKPESAVLVSLECPVHRLGVLPCQVVDCFARDPSFANLGSEVSLLVLDGVSEWISRKGVAEVLRALFRLLQVHAAVIVTLHADVVDHEILAHLIAASTSCFSLAGNRVTTLSKRKGGKVLRVTEEVIDWKVPTLKQVVDAKVSNQGCFCYF